MMSKEEALRAVKINYELELAANRIAGARPGREYHINFGESGANCTPYDIFGQSLEASNDPDIYITWEDLLKEV